MFGGEALVREANRRRAVTDGGRDPPDRAMADGVPTAKTPRTEASRGRSAIERPPRRIRGVSRDVPSGQDVAALEWARPGTVRAGCRHGRPLEFLRGAGVRVRVAGTAAGVVPGARFGRASEVTGIS